MMWWLKLVLPLVLAAAIGAAGFIKGMERGVEVQQDRHAQEIAAMQEGFAQTLERQDQEYKEVIQRHIQQLDAAQQLREADRERERELRTQIRSLTSNLSDLQGRIYASDIGECRVTDEFDRLFVRASGAGRSSTDEAGRD